MSKEGIEGKAWYAIGDYQCHLCENCPDTPPAPSFPPLAGEDSRWGTGRKRICGKCLDLVGKMNCKNPLAFPSDWTEFMGRKARVQFLLVRAHPSARTGVSLAMAPAAGSMPFRYSMLLPCTPHRTTSPLRA